MLTYSDSDYDLATFCEPASLAWDASPDTLSNPGTVLDLPATCTALPAVDGAVLGGASRAQPDAFEAEVSSRPAAPDSPPPAPRRATPMRYPRQRKSELKEAAHLSRRIDWTVDHLPALKRLNCWDLMELQCPEALQMALVENGVSTLDRCHTTLRRQICRSASRLLRATLPPRRYSKEDVITFLMQLGPAKAGIVVGLAENHLRTFAKEEGLSYPRAVLPPQDREGSASPAPLAAKSAPLRGAEVLPASAMRMP